MMNAISTFPPDSRHYPCHFGRVSPDVASRGVKSLNIEVPFEEALKLRLALDSCLHAINRYNRRTAKGRAMGVLLSVKTESASIAVIEAALRPARAADVAPAQPIAG